MIKFSAILTIELALEAVKRNGYALQYVPEAILTEAVALEAVKQNGYALQYVLSLDLFVKIASVFGINTDRNKEA
jgi:hypothetical protein